MARLAVLRAMANLAALATGCASLPNPPLPAEPVVDGPAHEATRDFSSERGVGALTSASEPRAEQECHGVKVSLSDLPAQDRVVTSDGATAIKLDGPRLRFFLRDTSGELVPDPHRAGARFHMADAVFLVLHPLDQEVAASGGQRTRSVGTGTDAADAEPTIHLIDVPSGQLQTTLRGHSAPIATVTYSQTGQNIASRDVRGGLRVWPNRVSPAQEVATDAVWFTFLGDERIAYLLRNGDAWVWNIVDGLAERRIEGRAIVYVDQDGAEVTRCRPVLRDD